MESIWPQPGYDSTNTSYNPHANGVSNGIEIRHEVDVGEKEIVDVIVTPDEYVTIGGRPATKLQGVSREDGNMTWSRMDSASPVFSGDLVFYKNGIHGIEPDKNRSEWHRTLKIEDHVETAETTVSGNKAYVGIQTFKQADSDYRSGKVFEFDLENKTFTGKIDTDGVAVGPFVTQSAIVCGMCPFFGQTHLEVWDRSGTLRWGKSDSDAGFNQQPLLVGNGHVFSICDEIFESDSFDPDDHTQKFIKAYDITDGDVTWQKGVWNGMTSPGVALINDILYISTRSKVEALNSHTGAQLWIHRRDDSNRQGSKLVASLDSLCVSGDRPIALDPDTGSLLWSIDRELTFHAIVNNELIASQDGDLLVLNDPDSSESDTEIYQHTDQDTMFCENCGRDIGDQADPSYCPKCGEYL